MQNESALNAESVQDEFLKENTENSLRNLAPDWDSIILPDGLGAVGADIHESQTALPVDQVEIISFDMFSFIWGTGWETASVATGYESIKPGKDDNKVLEVIYRRISESRYRWLLDIKGQIWVDLIILGGFFMGKFKSINTERLSKLELKAKEERLEPNEQAV